MVAEPGYTGVAVLTLALGAQRTSMRGMVLRQGLTLVVVDEAAGSTKLLGWARAVRPAVAVARFDLASL